MRPLPLTHAPNKTVQTILIPFCQRSPCRVSSTRPPQSQRKRGRHLQRRRHLPRGVQQPRQPPGVRSHHQGMESQPRHRHQASGEAATCYRRIRYQRRGAAAGVLGLRPGALPARRQVHERASQIPADHPDAAIELWQQPSVGVRSDRVAGDAPADDRRRLDFVRWNEFDQC